MFRSSLSLNNVRLRNSWIFQFVLCCRLIPSINYKGLPAGSPNLFNVLMCESNRWNCGNELANKTTECDKLSQGANGSGAKYHQDDAHCDACTAKPGK